MANRGSFTHTKGDPIYGIEVTYVNGTVSFKTFPSLAGLKSGLREIDSDIAQSRWGPASRKIYVTDTAWQPFSP